MNKIFKKIIASVFVTTSLVVLWGCKKTEPKPEPQPELKVENVEMISEGKTDYLWGSTFNPEGFAFKVTITGGKSGIATTGLVYERENEELINAALGSEDSLIKVRGSVTISGISYNFTYDLEINMQDPYNADTLIFKNDSNDIIAMYGDGSIVSYGIQMEEWKDYVANKGFWSWNGEELVIVLGYPKENSHMEFPVSYSPETGFSFEFPWVAISETQEGSYKTYTFSITITKEVAEVFLNSNTRFGDQDLKGKYPAFDPTVWGKIVE